MAPISTSWARLIRFVAAETSSVHIGEPVDPELDVGLAYHEKKTIKAFEIIGSALNPAASQLTENVLTVKHLLAPLSREEVKIVRCLGLNYSDHAAEAKMVEPTVPILFYKPASSLIGPDASIIVPKACLPVEKHIPDFEGELTIVIGKPCKNVSEEEALDYVLGYCTGQDMSFRYHQMTTSQWGFSKGFDNTTPFGPCIVSSKAIPNPQVLPLKTTLNGETMQDGNTSNMIFSVRKTVSFLSTGTTLEPGMLIMTGTPKGVGFARKPQVFMKHGDDIRVYIGGGCGTLVNNVVEEGRQ